MIVRRLALSGDYADTDWTDPAIAMPDNARRIKVTGDQLIFALRGKSEASDAGTDVDVGTLTVDAYLVSELGGTGRARGETLVEVKGDVVLGKIKLVGNDLARGEIVRLHLALTNVGALAALDVQLLTGGRVL